MYVCMDSSGHGHHQQHHQHLMHHPHMTISNTDSGGGGVGAGSSSDRFPQWSIQETRDFLMIRSELDPTFMETKRNKLLWDIISNKMKEKCYNRSSDQCKCKWKNLVTRYKGCETMEAEGMRQQFPFYNELQAIFAARMQRMLWMEAEGGTKKKMNSQLSSDDDDDNEDSEGDQSRSGKNKKRKVIKGGAVNVGGGSNSNGNNNNLKEILEEFMKKQTEMEAEWMKAYEAREDERRVKEMEWRQTMEALENERIMMERRWREREEQRRIREEIRAEKRDALITTLLNKLQRQEREEDDPHRRQHHHRMQ